MLLSWIMGTVDFKNPAYTRIDIIFSRNIYKTKGENIEISKK